MRPPVRQRRPPGQQRAGFLSLPEAMPRSRSDRNTRYEAHPSLAPQGDTQPQRRLRVAQPVPDPVGIPGRDVPRLPFPIDGGKSAVHRRTPAGGFSNRQPAGQDHQRDGQLHRRCWPRGITHQRGDVPGCASTPRKTPEPGGPSLAAGNPADLVGSRGLRRHPVRGVPGQTPGRQHERTTHDEATPPSTRRERTWPTPTPSVESGVEYRYRVAAVNLHRGGREVPQAGHSGDRFTSVG